MSMGWMASVWSMNLCSSNLWSGQFIPTTKFIHPTIQFHSYLLLQLGTWLKMALEPSSTSQQLRYYLHHGKLQCYPFFTSTCSVLCKKKLLVTSDQWQLTIWETISNNYEFALGFCKFKQKAPLLSWQNTTLQVERQRCPRTESDNGEPPWNLKESLGGSRLVEDFQTHFWVILHKSICPS